MQTRRYKTINVLNSRLVPRIVSRAYAIVDAWLLVSFLALVLFSHATNAQTAPFSELTHTDMKNQLHADEFVLVEVGDNTVPIMIYASEQAITKGVVFIMGDADMSFGRKDSLVNIASHLPSIGWTTVVLPSLGLSLGPNIAFPIIDESDESAPDEPGTELDTELDADTSNEPMRMNSLTPALSITEADLTIYAIEVEAYLSASISHMTSTMGHRIIVSQGISAASIVKLIADQTPSMQSIDALVINNPYWPIRELNNKIPMIVAQTPIPLLDLTSHWDNSWSKQTQASRQIRAKTDLKEVYRQSEIIGQSFDEAQMQYVSRHIKGWTSYLGW